MMQIVCQALGKHKSLLIIKQWVSMTLFTKMFINKSDYSNLWLYGWGPIRGEGGGGLIIPYH